MSVLDDFFGDSETAVKECLYCGGTDNLVVAINDANGPTHWCHEECRQQAEANLSIGTEGLPDHDRDTSVNGIE